MEFEALCTRDTHEEGAEVQIMDPSSGKMTDLYITVLGPDSREWRKTVKADLRKIWSRKKGEEITEDDLIQSDIDKLVAVTVGWRGMKNKGEDMPFSKEAVRTLYERSPRIMDQVDVFMADSRNFIKG